MLFRSRESLAMPTTIAGPGPRRPWAWVGSPPARWGAARRGGSRGGDPGRKGAVGERRCHRLVCYRGSAIRTCRSRAPGSVPGGGAHRPKRRASGLAGPGRVCPGWDRSHHWPAGTRALTWSMCRPQPAQVVLPQTLQVTGRHILAPWREEFGQVPILYPQGYNAIHAANPDCDR